MIIYSNNSFLSGGKNQCGDGVTHPRTQPINRDFPNEEFEVWFIEASS